MPVSSLCILLCILCTAIDGAAEPNFDQFLKRSIIIGNVKDNQEQTQTAINRHVWTIDRKTFYGRN